MLTVFMLALVGCNANNNGDNGNNGDNTDANDNVAPTRYNDNADRFTGERDGNVNQTRFNDRDGFDNDDNGATNNDRYEVAKEAADRITDEIKEIDRAYVLTTENNAYVAAQLDTDNNNNANANNNNNGANMDADNGDELTDEVKDRIADIVKSVDDDIDNVYVSTNPDFFDLTNNYATDLNNGKPVRGLFDQMGNMIERLFPQNR